MAYTSWSVSFGEQPSADKWNILGTNDAYFADYIDRPGFPVQIVSQVFSAAATGTGTIPLDDTIPQNTEGDEYMTLAITPTSATNILVIEALVYCASTSTATKTAALFQDSTADALAVGATFINVASARIQVHVKHRMVAGTTSATTFKIRAGTSTAGTMTFNGAAGGREYGAISKSSIVITEYKV